MSQEQMRSVVAQYFAAWSAMDPEKWVSCFAGDAMSHDPYGATPMRGRTALREFFGRITGAMQEITLSGAPVFTAKDRAAVQFKGQGVGKNGRVVAIEGIDVFEFNGEGKIQTLWAYWDPAEVLAKLHP